MYNQKIKISAQLYKPTEKSPNLATLEDAENFSFS
jgi:hypothetical protein